MIETLLLAQVEPPTIDGAYLLALVSRIAHTVCGAVLLGGSVYLRCVLVPAAEGQDNPSATLFAGRRSAWAGCVGAAALLLLASGFYNYVLVIRTYEKMPGAYHGLIGIKMLLALVVIALSSLLAGKTGAAEKVRGKAALWSSVCLAAAITIFTAGAAAKSYPHLPKPAGEQPTVEASTE